MKPPDLDGWIPFRLRWTPAPMADWCRLDDIRFTEPFFENTIQRAMRHPFRLLFRHQAPMEVLEERLESHPGIPPSGFIFHMSRCGSTLISRMLAASPANVVISEGWPIDSVITADLLHPEVTKEQRVRWLRAVIAALGQVRGGGEHRYFIKFDCWHALDLPLVRQAFPDVPWVFVYRDPVKVLVSQLRAPAAWTIPGLMPIRGHRENLPVLPIEHAARVLARICEAALASLNSGCGMLVNYKELPCAVFDRLAGHFGCRFTSEETAAMQDATRVDAKNPGFLFEPDSALKQRQAPPRAREIADELLYGLYGKLESYRATSL